jgi:cytochrome c peroxidase
VDLPPAAATGPVPVPGAPPPPVDASLAYSAAISPDGARLFVPRHALGDTLQESWFGRAVVDVMLTADDSPLAPARLHHGVQRDFNVDSNRHLDAAPITNGALMAEPRAIAYRRGTDTLLVASEGGDRVLELDATSFDPALGPLHVYDLHGPRGDAPGATRCGAPSGLALSADEATAFVYCRSTDGLAVVTLDPMTAGVRFAPGPVPVVSLVGAAVPRERTPVDVGGSAGSADSAGSAPKPPAAQAALGRRLFYDAGDPVMGGNLACAACHPEGRDDGHVWHEGYKDSDRHGMFAAPIREASPAPQTLRGAPRQTPMLAGRVSAKRPYGWRGKSVSLEQRIVVGFGLHRWHGAENDAIFDHPLPRAEALAAFLRTGLVPPPAERRDLTDQEQHGREVFESSATRCARCHFPATRYTDGSRVTLAVLDPPPGFLGELDPGSFKTPSLLYVGGTPPYLHDGREATLEDLVEHNHDRMGRTEALDAADRAALVAFLKTIGTVDPALPRGVGDPITVERRAGRRPAAVDPAPPLAGPGPGPFEADPPPLSPSAPPTWAEWTSAPEVGLLHPSERCHVFRVREWVRVNCEAPPSTLDTASVELVSGPTGGVDLSRNRHGKGGEIVFPLRRGERRLLTMHEVAQVSRWQGFRYGLAHVITAAWLPGAAAPSLTVQ